MKEMLDKFLSADGGRAVQMIGALLIVIALIFLFAWLMRRFSQPKGLKPAARKGGERQAARLAVVDAAFVDSQRRLVLVRRDDVEHLVMIGGPNDVLIEPRIVRGVPLAGQRQPQQPVSAARQAPAPQAAPTPAYAAQQAQSHAAPPAHAPQPAQAYVPQAEPLPELPPSAIPAAIAPQPAPQPRYDAPPPAPAYAQAPAHQAPSYGYEQSAASIGDVVAAGLQEAMTRPVPPPSRTPPTRPSLPAPQPRPQAYHEGYAHSAASDSDVMTQQIERAINNLGQPTTAPKPSYGSQPRTPVPPTSYDNSRRTQPPALQSRAPAQQPRPVLVAQETRQDSRTQIMQPTGMMPSADQVRNAQRPDTRKTPNDIEDEMARLLSELTGTAGR